MKPADFDISFNTIPELLAQRLKANDNAIAIVDDDLQLSYADLSTLVKRTAASLSQMGIGNTSFVAIWGGNSWYWAVAAMASWWCGAVIVPISARAKGVEAALLLDQIEPDLLFVDPVLAAQPRTDTGDARSMDYRCPAIALAEKPHELPHGLKPWAALSPGKASMAESPAQVKAEDLCEILFTSGSSGTPKGVLRQHGQVITNRFLNGRRRGFLSEDVLLALPPFSHTLGLNGILLRTIMLGATMVITRNSNPRHIAELIQRHQITALAGPPSLYESLLASGDLARESCSSLRLASIGSASIPPELVSTLLASGVASVASGYGMTECDTIASATSDMGIDAVAHTVGTPDPGIEVKIVDEHDQEVAPQTTGEIWVRGYATTPGYFRAGDDSAELYARGHWMRTGDLGYWTKQGFLKVRGRRSEIITTFGYKVYPAEVEQLLLHSGLLQSVAVLGVAQRIAGQQCIAFVVPRQPEIYRRRELQLWARQNLADYKIPTQIFELEELPLNTAGKVDRMALRRHYEVAHA
ncbi:MAG: AMP-binding protein [Pseudomonadota bacterium]